MKSGKMQVILTAAIVIIAAYAAVATYMLVLPSDSGKATASVREIYELQYETNATILNVAESNGMYKITVQFTDYTGNRTTNDIFVTKDGKLIADRLIIADTYKRLLSAQKSFSECLSSRGLRILGRSNDTATLQQLNVLGVYAYKVFVSCDGFNDAACRNLGVQRYPTTIYNNTGYDSLYSAEFFSQLTGCELLS